MKCGTQPATLQDAKMTPNSAPLVRRLYVLRWRYLRVVGRVKMPFDPKITCIRSRARTRSPAHRLPAVQPLCLLMAAARTPVLRSLVLSLARSVRLHLVCAVSAVLLAHALEQVRPRTRSSSRPKRCMEIDIRRRARGSKCPAGGRCHEVKTRAFASIGGCHSNLWEAGRPALALPLPPLP